MKWLSQKQIKEAAKKSPKAAHDCVIEHWTQLATCTFREFIAIVKAEHQIRNIIGSSACAYCLKYQGVRIVCDGCPVCEKTRKDYCEDTPFVNADEALGNFKRHSTQANFNLFHKAAKKELKFLKSL